MYCIFACDATKITLQILQNTYNFVSKISEMVGKIKADVNRLFLVLTIKKMFWYILQGAQSSPFFSVFPLFLRNSPFFLYSRKSLPFPPFFIENTIFELREKILFAYERAQTNYHKLSLVNTNKYIRLRRGP